MLLLGVGACIRYPYSATRTMESANNQQEQVDWKDPKLDMTYHTGVFRPFLKL